MVTWGNTTVFGDASKAGSAPSLFSGSVLGSSTSTTPGTSPFQFSSFSSPAGTPAPTSPGTSLFSTPSSGATPAAISTGFANPMGGGAANANNAPQQAAIQAHMNATLHQEASRLESKLQSLYNAYTPTPATAQGHTQPLQQTPGGAAQPAGGAGTNPSECKFQFIFYNQMTPSQRLEKLSYESASNTSYPPPPTPSFPTETWTQALAQNPNSDEYIPVLITSAEGLHSRLVSQQSTMDLHSTYVTQLNDALDTLHKSIKVNQAQLKYYTERNATIRQQLLKLMNKLELCRGKNIVLQPSERMAFLEGKVGVIMQYVMEMERVMEEVRRDGEVYVRQLQYVQQQKRLMMGVGGSVNDRIGGATEPIMDAGLKKEVDAILKEQRNGMEELNKVLKKDERDLEIIKQGNLDSSASTNTAGSSSAYAGLDATRGSLSVRVGAFQ